MRSNTHDTEVAVDVVVGRAHHRVTGIVAAAIFSLALWTVIGVVVWAVVSALGT
ncbi:hypothetical protein [Marisediminicola sp. LYQ134]|uniref:hypothetical protein n=1 Tax=unclassified Marisediminicola TaxID=2618316 RepID=UPI00398324EB